MTDNTTRSLNTKANAVNTQQRTVWGSVTNATVSVFDLVGDTASSAGHIVEAGNLFADVLHKKSELIHASFTAGHDHNLKDTEEQALIDLGIRKWKRKKELAEMMANTTPEDIEDFTAIMADLGVEL